MKFINCKEKTNTTVSHQGACGMFETCFHGDVQSFSLFFYFFCYRIKSFLFCFDERRYTSIDRCLSEEKM